ncbi:MAG TPA: host attachment family protein [Sphingobium sp.]|nr:host attachment family protein [Sphingobium sp.]
MRLPHDCLILVADGRKMLLLRNQGTSDDPSLAVDYGLEQPNPADRAQKSDARGQRPSVGSPGQASAGEADYHQQAEDDFARDAAAYLNALALRNALTRLIVIAPPRTLGELRRHYHRAVTARLVTEIAKTMTGHPIDAIAKFLVAHEEVA